MASKSKSRAKLYSLFGDNKKLTVGGQPAVGSIEFANIPANTETITIGDYTVEFTTGSSDATAAGTVADPLLVNIKGSLTLTIDELIVVLLAATGTTGAWGYLHPIDATALENVTDTTLQITFFPGKAGNNIVLDGSAGDETIVQPTGGTAVPNISFEHKATVLDPTDSAANLEYYNLPNGEYVGQEVTIVVETLGASDTPTITGNFKSNTTAYVTMTFDVAEEFAKLIWTGSYWKPVHASGNEAFAASA